MTREHVPARVSGYAPDEAIRIEAKVRMTGPFAYPVTYGNRYDPPTKSDIASPSRLWLTSPSTPPE